MHRNSILLVADIEPLIFSLTKQLSEDGYSVVVAKSADDALHLLQMNPRIGLAICDLAVRRTDCVELMKQIMRICHSTDQGELPPPKIIALTTPNTTYSKDAAIVAKETSLYTDHNSIPKPVDPRDLLARVHHLIGYTSRTPERKEVSGMSDSHTPAPSIPEVIDDRLNLIDEKIRQLDEQHDQSAVHVQALDSRLTELENAPPLEKRG
jgi:CheY-like chemotaxis protein